MAPSKADRSGGRELRRVVVTGGAGFLGSAVVAALLSRNVERVTVVDFAAPEQWWRLESVAGDTRVSRVSANLRDHAVCADILAGHDAVIHLAEATETQRSSEYLADRLDGSLGLLLSVLGAVRADEALRSFVYVSSAAVYGRSGSERPVAEDEPLAPASFYGASKVAGEAFVQASAFDSQAQMRIVRPCNIVGPTMSHGALASFATQIWSGSGVLRGLGDGQQTRSFLHVEDCANAILHVAQIDDDACEAFNVAARDALTVRELAAIVADELDPTIEIRFDGASATWRGDVAVLLLEVSKLRHAGWSTDRSSADAVRTCLRAMTPGFAATAVEPNQAARRDESGPRGCVR